MELNMEIKDLQDAKTAEEARQYAIDWQNWQAEQSLSYGELAEWQEVFTTLAEKFGLEEEFAENGLISREEASRRLPPEAKAFAMSDIGLTEDEADMAIDDFENDYL